MSAPSPAEADLMPSLGRMVRGLTLLFWSLPLALLVCVQTARTGVLGSFGMFPPVLANAALLHGVMLLRTFRRQEGVWARAVERTLLLALVNVGLAPFLYWWKLLPGVPHYQVAVATMACTGLLFLVCLNLALQRLAAMLPDQTLRLEAKLFTTLNLGLLVATALLGLAGSVFWLAEPLPAWAVPLGRLALHLGLAVLLVFVLLPLALTMTLIWKIKDAILWSVFGQTK
jgi:hypothetical protein